MSQKLDGHFAFLEVFVRDVNGGPNVETVNTLESLQVELAKERLLSAPEPLPKRGDEYGWTDGGGEPHYGVVTNVERGVIFVRCQCHRLGICHAPAGEEAK